jgi:hypothetical protein
MRNNAMSLSFGFVTIKSRRRNDGINELRELDLFEVSIVPAPANADTRVLSMKALEADPEFTCVRDETRTFITGLLKADDAAFLRKHADRVAREHAPVQIASFEC